MSTIAKLIAEGAIKYLNKSSNSEIRLIVPGLTNTISKQIHDELISKKINSYLVVGPESGMAPDETKKHLMADALTSVRQGSFVIVTTPGQLALLQEGIKGPGGVADTAYPEDFPFNEDGAKNEFKFSQILSLTADKWTSINKEERTWIKDLLTKHILQSCRSLKQVKRQEFFLQKLIEGFDPDNPDTASISDHRERFLYHCGLPREIKDSEDAKDYGNDIKNLCTKIHDQIKKSDDILDNAKNIINADSSMSDVEKKKTLDCFESYRKALGKSMINFIPRGILSISGGCIKINDKAKRLEVWEHLDREKLQKLFEIEKTSNRSNHKIVINKIKLLNRSGGHPVKSNNSLVVRQGESYEIEYQYEIDEPNFNPTEWSIVASQHSTQLEKDICSSEKGSGTITLTAPDNSKKALTQKLGIHKNDNTQSLKSVSFKIHVCGQDRPKLLILDRPGENLDVIDIVESNKHIESISKFDSAADVIVMLHQKSNKEPVLDMDEEKLDLKPATLPSDIFHAKDTIDLKDINYSNPKLTVKHEKGEASVILSSSENQSGSFTLEDEYRLTLVEGKKAKLKKIHQLFNGSFKRPYPGLGDISAEKQKLVNLAKTMEKDKAGWKMIISDLLSRKHKTEDLGQYVIKGNSFDDSVLNRIKNNTKKITDTELNSLHHKYISIRADIIGFYKNWLNPTHATHPVYASTPVYIELESKKIEDLISKYLTSYININNKLIDLKNNQTIERDEALILSSMDKIVHMGPNTKTDDKLFMLGPWHPLVLAKRYMCQRSLYMSSQRYIDSKEIYQFNRLATLIGDASGITQGNYLSSGAIKFESCLLSATNDPGWILGIKSDLLKDNKSFSKMQIDIKESLGISLKIFNLGLNHLSENFINRFRRAYPEKRRIDLYIREGYNGDHIIESAQELLLKSNEKSDYKEYKDIGKLLSGGIHYHVENLERWTTENTLSVGDKSFFYSCQETKRDETIKKNSIDIEVLSSHQDLEIDNENERKETLCRANGLNSVYYASPSKIDEGDEIWTSRLYASDSPRTPTGSTLSMGDLFIDALNQQYELSGKSLEIKKKNTSLPKQSFDTKWLYMPSTITDPAVLVKFIEDIELNQDPNKLKALWDYKHDIGRNEQDSYYTMSSIPKGIDASIAKQIGGNAGTGNKMIASLGKSGVAIGGEALKTTNTAKGAVGLAAAVALFNGFNDNGYKILTNNQKSIGFLLPVDSFETILGNKIEKKDSKHQKLCDLLAIQLVLPNKDNPKEELQIMALAIEAKYRSNPDHDDVQQWFKQSNDTFKRFESLVNIAKEKDDSGIPERLGLLHLLHFGVRLSYRNNEEWTTKEQLFLSAILEGRFNLRKLKTPNLVILTEPKDGGDATYLETTKLDHNGILIKLNKDNWPGLADSDSLKHNIYPKIEKLFSWEQEESQGSSEETPTDETPTEETPTEETPTEETPTEETPTDEPPTDEPIDTDDTCDVSIKPFLIGTTNNEKKPVIMDFDGSIQGRNRLENRHIVISGGSGKGKTTFLKTLAANIRKQNGNILIFDLKAKDFSGDEKFCRSLGFSITHCRDDGLPFNPLIPEPMKRERTGEIFYNYRQHISNVVSAIAIPFNLTQFQKAALQNAITNCFERSLINVNEETSTIDVTTIPTLSEIEEILDSGNNYAKSAKIKLESLFIFNTFPEENKHKRFNDLVKSSSILDLTGFQDDGIKSAITRLVMVSALAHFNGKKTTGKYRWGVVLDEAHRLKGLPELERTAREGRALGISLILSSQLQNDFGGEVSSNIATSFSHGYTNQKEDNCSKLALTIGWREDLDSLINLGIFQAVTTNNHYANDITNTLGWPHYLIYEFILSNGPIEKGDILTIDGIDPSQLNSDQVLNHMINMGIITLDTNDMVNITDTYKSLT